MVVIENVVVFGRGGLLGRRVFVRVVWRVVGSPWFVREGVV